MAKSPPRQRRRIKDAAVQSAATGEVSIDADPDNAASVDEPGSGDDSPDTRTGDTGAGSDVGDTKSPEQDVSYEQSPGLFDPEDELDDAAEDEDAVDERADDDNVDPDSDTDLGPDPDPDTDTDTDTDTDNPSATAAPAKVGPGHPPVATRFKPGQSGNPAGRPRKDRNLLSHVEAELDSMMVATEGEVSLRLTKREALAKSLVNKAVLGDPKAVTALLRLLGTASNTDESPVATIPLDSVLSFLTRRGQGSGEGDAA
ncbi:MAG TPA: DUF5681 domain-containing protein [Croceicoccus sp.]|nr:DUF5681 domain-containing protein [Croceicoccus sp.]